MMGLGLLGDSEYSSEAEKLKKQRDEYKGLYEAEYAHTEKLRTENEKLRTALEFIAAPGALQTAEDWQMKRAKEAVNESQG